MEECLSTILVIRIQLFINMAQKRVYLFKKSRQVVADFLVLKVIVVFNSGATEANNQFITALQKEL